jgi:hypothetical protein
MGSYSGLRSTTFRDQTLCSLQKCKSPFSRANRHSRPQNDPGHKRQRQSRLKESSPQSWFGLCQKASRNTSRSSLEHGDSAPLNWQAWTVFRFASSISQTVTFWKFKSLKTCNVSKSIRWKRRGASVHSCNWMVTIFTKSAPKLGSLPTTWQPYVLRNIMQSIFRPASRRRSLGAITESGAATVG